MILANEDMFPDPPSGVLGELDPPLKEPPCGIFKAVPACIDPSPSGNSKFVVQGKCQMTQNITYLGGGYII